MAGTAKRRYEPERRTRLVDVTLDVIAKHGVAGTTHRRVAEAAGVPLGSMTYHFDGLDDLLVSAFSRLAEMVSDRYKAAMEGAGTIEDAREAVVELICGGVWASERNMMLSYELYAYTARNPKLKEVLVDWMARSHRYLELHFTPPVARALDAIIEGVTIHNTTSRNTISRDEVRDMVKRITTLTT